MTSTPLPIVKKAAKKFRDGQVFYSNIVCTSRIPVNERINLRRISRKTLNVISSMGNGHAVSFRFTNPTMTCSLYDTGSIIHCGGNSMIAKIGSVRRLIEMFQTRIPEVVPNIRVPIRVVNTMTTIRVPYNVDIMSLYNSNPMQTSYFKENFTGCTLTLLNTDRKITATVFTTGSVNLAGCISAYEYRKYSKRVLSILNTFRDEYVESSEDGYY